MKIFTINLLWILAFTIIGGCEKNKKDVDSSADSQGHTMPTEFTIKANARVLKELPFHDQQDFENATKGLIASDPALRIRNAQGEIIWDQTEYSFMKEKVPNSANPSLWRQARLNNIHGLFKVTDGIYQLRGYDLANMTIIEGETGWIIVDPLTAEETAKSAIAFARKHLGDKPIVAIIFTHSHIDHFGGVQGLVNEENVRIIAPHGFMDEATSENIIAGVAMARRSGFMYGKDLARTERGHIGTGLGKGPAIGTFGIRQPTEIIDHTPQQMTIDGVKFIFQNAPGSEAPAELTFYLPELKAFCGAEVVSRTMHNLYTLRGTKIRDAVKWSSYIQDIIDRFGGAETYFGSHHWPLWGNEAINDFLTKQRDVYKYIHDQTVRLFNEGFTPSEIAEMITLPESLSKSFSIRGYYGTLKHNAKAVYQGYLGWYDGNPANLNPLPPTEAGVRYVKLMGGAELVISKAQAAFDQGEYRWVAELLNHLVFAEPNNDKAKALLARAYDQMGYQAESAPWRDVYLSGAYELRHGAPEKGLEISLLKKILEQTSLTQFFNSLSVRLNGPKAEGVDLTVKIEFTDLKKGFELWIENAVLHHREAQPETQADATIQITHPLFVKMIVGQVGVKDTLFSDDLSVEGSKFDLVRFFSLFSQPSGTFNIVVP